MKLTYSNPTSRIQIEAEVSDAKTAFETVAEVQELFDEKACGACQSTNIRCDVRTAQGFRFYNLKCRGCSARLDFGQHQDSKTLFAKRRNDDGSAKPHNGWYVYQAEPGNQTPRTQTDHDLSSITTAKTIPALEQIVKWLNREIAVGKIPLDRKNTLLEAVQRRKAELGGRPSNQPIWSKL